MRFLASAGNRRGEAVVLEVGSENDALGERIDRSGGRGVGRIYATRQIALDGIASMGVAGVGRAAAERRIPVRHRIAIRTGVGHQAVDLVESDFTPIAGDALGEILRRHVQDNAVARIADQRRHARTHVHVHRNVGRGDIAVLSPS